MWQKCLSINTVAVKGFPNYSERMKDYYKNEQNILEDKIEYHRQNIRDAEDELVDEQSIIPLRCKLLDLCSTRDLT